MSIFTKTSQGTLVPIHPDNAKTKDWVVLLEAATILGQSRDKLRVALTTYKRKLVRKKKLFQKPRYFLVVDGYHPGIPRTIFLSPALSERRSRPRSIEWRSNRATDGASARRWGCRNPRGMSHQTAGRKNLLSARPLRWSLTALSSIPRVRVQMDRLCCALRVPETEKVSSAQLKHG